MKRPALQNKQVRSFKNGFSRPNGFRETGPRTLARVIRKRHEIQMQSSRVKAWVVNEPIAKKTHCTYQQFLSWTDTIASWGSEDGYGCKNVIYNMHLLSGDYFALSLRYR